MVKTIACVITKMFENTEYNEPAKAFTDAGHKVVVIVKEKGNKITGAANEITVTADEGFDDVNPDDYDALFIQGVFSLVHLRDDVLFVVFDNHIIDVI